MSPVISRSQTDAAVGSSSTTTIGETLLRREPGAGWQGAWRTQNRPRGPAVDDQRLHHRLPTRCESSATGSGVDR